VLFAPWERIEGESLRDHLWRLTRMRGAHATALARDGIEVLDRLEALERRVAALEAERR
jgi:hypothetical protein